MHTGPITSVVVSKDGRYVFTGGYDKNIYLWDRQSGMCKLIGKHRHLVNSLAISEGGRWLASSSSDYTIHLYDLQTEDCIRVLYGHNDDVEGLSFVDLDSKLVSVSRDHRALVWDVETGRIITEFRGHSKDVLSVWTFRNQAFTTADDGRCLVWNWANGHLHAEIGPFDYELDAVGGHSKGLFAIGGDDGRVFIYHAEDLQLHNTLQAHQRGVKRVVFSPSGCRLLTAGYDHRIKIWNVETGQIEKELPAFRYQWERALAWTPDESRILSGSFGNTYAEWDVEHALLLTTEAELATPSINDMAVGPNNIIVTASDDGKFRIQGNVVNPAGGVLTNGVAISSDARWVLWGDHAGNVTLIDGNNGEIVKVLETGTGPINTVRYYDKQHAFYVGTYGGFVHCFDIDKQSWGLQWQAHQGAVKALEVNDRHVVTCSSDGSIYAYNRTQPAEKVQFLGPTAIVNDVCLHPDGRHIVAVGRDKVVRVYEIFSQKVVSQHLEHRYSVKSVTVAADGSIYAGDYWGYVSIWHPDQNKKPVVFRVGRNGISALRAVGVDVYASSYDGCVYRVNRHGHIQEALRLFHQSQEVVEC